MEQLYRSFAERYLSIDRSGMNGLQQLLLLIQIQIERNRNDLSCAKVFVRAYTTALRTAVYKDLPAAQYDAPLREIVYHCIEEGIRDGSIRRDIAPLDTYLLISSNYMGLVLRLIYFYSVGFTKEEHRAELLLVFIQYVHMLEKYLKAE